MFTRNKYLDQLLDDTQHVKIKVLLGIRRSGKSALLEQCRTTLRRQGIDRKQIQLIDFNWLQDRRLLRTDFLVAAIKKKLIPDTANFLFLDELEVIPHFAPLLKQLLTIENLQIVITGSTKQTLRELQPLKDQCQIIPVLPLTYHEYLQWHGQKADSQSLYQYLNVGGFPFAQNIRNNDSSMNYIEEVISTTIMSAFIRQGTMCKPSLATQLATLLVNNIGKPLNISQAVTALKQVGIKASNKTVATYLQLLEDTFLLLPCYEFNLKTGKPKSTNVRYFAADSSIKNTLMHQRSAISKANLLAVIFRRLFARGYQVYTAQWKGEAPCFVAIKNGQRHYYCYAYALPSQEDYQELVVSLKLMPGTGERTLLVAKKPQFLLQKDNSVENDLLLDWLTE